MSLRQAAVIAIFGLSTGAQQQPALVTARQSALGIPAVSETIGRIADILSGTWSITVSKVEGESREAVTGHGEEVWRFSPGAVFVEENRSTVNGKPAEDCAALWWDTKSQKTRGIWCSADINDEGCSGFTVTLDGNDIVMNGVWEMRGTRYAWRETFSVSQELGADTEGGRDWHTIEAGRDYSW